MHHEESATKVLPSGPRIREVLRSLPAGVRLIAVTKGVAVEGVQAAIAAGVTDIGENRVQEAIAKQAALPGSRATWHLIGRLQGNKIRRAVAHFDWIHSVESLQQAEAISRAAESLGKRQNVLVQVNVAGEASKGGMSPDEAWAALPSMGNLAGLAVRGLMTIAPWTGDPAAVRPVFRGLAELRQRANAQGWRGIDLQELSMGMSGDYQAAIAEGATMIRLGQALFGPRQYAPGTGAARKQ